VRHEESVFICFLHWLGTSTTFDDNRPSSSLERLEAVSISSMFSRVEPWACD